MKHHLRTLSAIHDFDHTYSLLSWTIMVVMVTIEDNHKLDHAWLSWLPLKITISLTMLVVMVTTEDDILELQPHIVENENVLKAIQ